VFLESLTPYADAIDQMAANTQRNRVLTMLAVGVVASLAAPMMISAGLPALGATGSIFGMTVTGSPFLAAALPASASFAMSTTMNAAMQFEGTGQVSWGHALLGGAVDGLTSYYGTVLAARAMQRGLGYARTVGTAASLDAAGGFASYVLGTPGALSSILSGDPRVLDAALAQAGFGFVVSAGVNGALYRVNLGDVPPLGRATNATANDARMSQLLSDGVGSIFDGSVPVRGLNGELLDPSTLTTANRESYFAVYRNRATGEVVVQEVATARPGQPLALEAFDVVAGVRRNAPGAGWDAVGGFHNHVSGSGSASSFDLALEPVFRGELGTGFVSYTLGANGASRFASPAAPISLADAYRLGAVTPLSDSMFDGLPIPSNWRGGLETVVEDYSRGLNAIIADPRTPAPIRDRAMQDMNELYTRFGAVVRGADHDGTLTAAGQAELAALNDWVVEVMPRYQPAFEATVARGGFRFGNQVSTSNSASQTAVEMELLFTRHGFAPNAWLDAVRGAPDANVYVVGLANGGGAPAGHLWSDALAGGFDPNDGAFGLLVPTQRTSNAASSFALTLDPPPRAGDTVVIVDDLMSSGDSGRAAIEWMQKNYPDVTLRFVASGASGTHRGVTMVDWGAVYGP
jgi:orotate phosphoribosyltransferase